MAVSVASRRADHATAPPRSGPGPDFHVSRRGLPDDAIVDAFLHDCRGSGLTVGERTLLSTSLTAARVAEAAA